MWDFGFFFYHKSSTGCSMHLSSHRLSLLTGTLIPQLGGYRFDRNPARAKLEETYGFDSKHGMHLIRILRMGLEIIKDGKVIVRRPDKDELLDIRNGKVSYEALLQEAEDLKNQIDAAVEKSPLPEEADYEAAQNLCVALIKDKLYSNMRPNNEIK